MKFTGTLRASLLIGTAFVGGANGALAQDNGDSLGDIIVTAQKREQSIQDVPIAVTAIAGETLQANRIVNVQDLSGLAPNTIVRPSAGGTGIATFSMRGVVSYGVVPGSDKQVSIYLDGVYISSTRGSIFDVPDLERIEVLRGPQGTLFGRNATAGAVSLVTREPNGIFSVTQEVTVGNYDQFRSRTSVSLPQWGPFSAYGSFVHNERNGDIKNLGAGTSWDRTGPDGSMRRQASPKYLGSKDANSFFGALKFEPSDAFKTIYKFDRTVDNFTPEGNGVVGINRESPLLGPLFGALVDSSPNPVVFAPSGKRPKEVNNWFVVGGLQRNTGHSLTSELRVSDSISLKNIAAYRKSYLYGVSEIGGLGGLIMTPQAVPAYIAFLVGNGQPLATATATANALVGTRFIDVATQRVARAQQWSDELQLNYDSKLLTLTLGGIWFKSKDREGGPESMRGTYNLIPGINDATGVLPLGNAAVSFNKATSIAAYGQAEIHVTEQIDIIGGARITRDKKSGSYVSGGTFVPATPGSRTEGTLVGATVSTFNYKKSEPSYAIGVNFKPADDVLLFGKFSTAYVSGGSIGGVAWEPETASAWELGAKGTFLDGRLRTNLALFDVTYKHQQSAQGGRNVGRPDLGTVIIDLLAETQAKGVEFEATALPVRGVTLGASLGYSDVKIKGAINPLVLSSVGLPASGSANYAPTLIPKWTSNLSAQYETEPLFGDARMTFRVDANWRSKFRTDANIDVPLPVFAPSEFSPASWVVNARVALADIKFGIANGSIALWARNLNDNKASQFPTPVRPTFIATSYQPARTFGIDLKLNLQP